jgi:hypothetical protein
MADEPEPEAPPAPMPPPVAPPPPGFGQSSDAPRDGAAARPADRPELVVGAAFAGGFALAMILRRLAR